MGKSLVMAIKRYPAPLTLLAAVACAAACTEPAQPPGPAKPGAFDPVAHADTRLKTARENFQAAAQPDDCAWQLGEACYDRAEFAKDNPERAALAQEGMDACRKLIDAQPANPGGHYYLGMNIGQMARVKRFSALGLVKDMEHAFTTARDLSATFSHAGPDRNLGLLYFKAPPIISVGNNTKARAHLERAVKLAPDYPANRLNLLEAYIDWEDAKGVAAQLTALRQLLPKARQQFTGDNWATSWLEWDKRWLELRGPNSQ
jgi:tetratricopeptide (TPR) repeat protein